MLTYIVVCLKKKKKDAMPQTLKEITLVHLKKGKKNNIAQKQNKFLKKIYTR